MEFFGIGGRVPVQFVQLEPPLFERNTVPPPICEKVTQMRCGLLGSTAMQLIKRGAGVVRIIFVQLDPVQLTRNMRPAFVPIRIVFASISRMAVAISPLPRARPTVLHGAPPVRVTSSALPAIATVEPKTSTGG